VLGWKKGVWRDRRGAEKRKRQAQVVMRAGGICAKKSRFRGGKGAAGEMEVKSRTMRAIKGISFLLRQCREKRPRLTKGRGKAS